MNEKLQKEETLDRIAYRSRFGGGCGTAVWQSMWWWWWWWWWWWCRLTSIPFV